MEVFNSKVIYILLGQSPNNKEYFADILKKGDMIIDLTRPQDLWFFFRNEALRDSFKNFPGYISGEDYAVETFEAAKTKFLKWISQAPDSKIIHGKSLKELFVYDKNVSIWWLTGASQKQFNKTPFGTYFHQTAAIERILNDYHDTLNENLHQLTFVLFTDTDSEYKYFSYKTAELARKIFKPYQLDILVKRGKFNPKKELQKKLTGFFKNSYYKFKKNYLIKCTYQVFCLLMACRQIKIKNNQTCEKIDILINTGFPKDWRNGADSHSDLVQDRYLADVFEYLCSKGKSVAWLPVLITPKDVKEWFLQTSLPNAIHLRLDFIQIVKIYFKIISCLWKWQHLFNLLRKDQNLQLRKKSNGWISDALLMQCLLDDIRNQIKGDCISSLLKYELIKQGLSPMVKYIFLRKEFHTSSRLVTAALKSTKTQIVGVQHGMAREVYYQYFLTSEETGLTCKSEKMQKDYITYMPVPDYDLLFGEHTKKMLLTHGGYPEKRMIVTGATRQDAAVKRMLSLSPLKIKNIKQQIGLPMDRKIIALCPALSRFVKEISELMMEAIQLAKANLFLLIKLHPHFGGRDSVLRAAHNKSFTDFIITDTPIDDAILVSDIVSSQISTICYETVLLQKPHVLIAKDLVFRKDKVFSEEPCITPVFNAKQASEIIDKLLMDEGLHEIFMQKREKFLNRYLNNADGKALERVIHFIEKRI